MQDAAPTGADDGLPFPALVEALAADPERRERLTELLREDHPLYDQRGAAAIVHMRGWVLLALARTGVSDGALLFVLEELDTGVDAYLVAAAARALRSYPQPSAALAPFVARALNTMRYHDDPVSFERYGDDAVASGGTSPMREVLATLAWLGPHARAALPAVEALGAHRGGLSRALQADVDRALGAIRAAARHAAPGAEACCALPGGLRRTWSWARGARRNGAAIESMMFEDHAGEMVTFKQVFAGHPSIVVFFFTRCDNPLKCSLTITKLARVQALLAARGLAARIHTAAITYDPAFDLPDRLRGYGQHRGVRLDAGHRMLRAVDGVDGLRRHFGLGVNFIASLVNRHRIEVYLLDAAGRTAVSFERLHWDEQEVVERAVELLAETRDASASEAAPPPAAPSGRSAVPSA
ncbi:MAG: SCO family protein, partial [Candidatus Binatia bacterium]